MIQWLFQILPSAVYEPFFYVGLAGLLLFAADKRQGDFFREKKLLLLLSFLFMVLWRMFFARVASRYSVLLIPLFLLFSSYALVRLRDFLPERIRTFAFFLLLGTVFLFCAGKIAVQYDPVRIRLFRSVGKCIRHETGRVCLACDTKDGRRLAWYAGIPEHVRIDRQGTSPQDCHQALFPVKNMDCVFYVVLQHPAVSRPLTASEMNLPEKNWQFCGEFLKDKHKKYMMRIYRYRTEPHWKTVSRIQEKTDKNPSVFYEGFERPEKTGKQAAPGLPEGWIINGVLRDDVKFRIDRENAAAGTGSLSVSASVTEILPAPVLPAGKDYTLHFLVRGRKGTSLIVRMYVYPPKGPGTGIFLDRFLFEDEKLHECRIPLRCSAFPADHTFKFSFIIYDGEIVLDEIFASGQ